MSWPAWNTNISLQARNLSSDIGNMGPMNTLSILGPIPGMPNTGNMPNMGNIPNMGNVPSLGNMPSTPGNAGSDQWNAMQSAQWQQWAQWQQQYAQWHNQYGDKYSQQMQMGGAMVGGVPGVPAPPPPDKPPPPPPPHENDQPLYAKNSAQSKSSPPAFSVPNPADQTQKYRNSNVPIASIQPLNTADNYSNWSPPTSTTIEGNVASNNSDALNKLAEEKRLFDIQFKKWEQEIENWKRENVNHPDKKAYKDYEDKFEACRAQLLERRKQMDLRKAKLMGFSGQSNSAPTPGNLQISNDEKSLNNFNDQNSFNRNQINSRFSDSKQQQRFRDNNKNADPQDRYASYENPNNISIPTNTSPQSSNFIPTKDFNKGIPGLDLVPHSEKPQMSNNPIGPDYSTISRGIDSILGDEKIMNILSMVRDQGVPGNRVTNQQSNNRNNNFQPNQQSSTSNYNNQHPNQSQNRHWQKNRDNYSYDDNEDIHSQMPYHQHGNNNNQNINRFDNQQQGNYQVRGGQQRLLPRQQQGPQGCQQRGPQGNQQLGPRGNEQQGHQGNEQHGPRGNQQQGARANEQFGPRGNQQQGPHGNEQHRPRGNQQQGPRSNEQFGTQGNQQQGPQGNQQHGPQGNEQHGPQGNQHQGTRGNVQFGPGGNQQHGPRNNQQQGPQGNEQHAPRGNQQGPRGNQQQGPRGNLQQAPRGNQQQGPQGNQRNMQGNVNMMGQNFQNNLNKNALLNTSQKQMPQPSFNRNIPDEEYYDDENNYDQQEYSDNYGGNRVQSNVQIRPKGSQGMMQQQQNQFIPKAPTPAPKRVWPNETIFTPSVIVDYEHKQLRLKAREFIEPVHTFDYNHKSKFEDERRREYNEVASRRFDDYEHFRGRGGREQKVPPRERDYDRRQFEPSNEWRPTERRYTRAEDASRPYSRPTPTRDHLPTFQRNRDRRSHERNDSRGETRGDDRRETRADDRRETRADDRRETRADDRRETRADDRRETRTDDRRETRNNSRSDTVRVSSRNSRERDSLKRPNTNTDEKNQPDNKQSKSSTAADIKNIYMITDLIESPGRDVRPRKIAIILRGPPGSGKSYLAKLIRDKEAEYGTSIRIMSIDDYFTQDSEVEEKDPATGKMVKKNIAKYDYDPKLEPVYIESLKKSFKKTLSDGYFSFLIFDAVNNTPESYFDVWLHARQNNFQVYVCTLEMDPLVCHKRNIHNRSLDSIKAICAEWGATPTHHLQLDPTALLQNAAITEVTMEDVDNCVIIDDDDDDDVVEVEASVTSKWEKMDDVAQLARLDGTSKPLRPTAHLSMEDYLQLDDWQPTKATPGKKTVRWADIEESRQQEKMRAIGFVVGQTDWNRMTDPTMGSSALTKTKYIENVRRH